MTPTTAVMTLQEISLRTTSHFQCIHQCCCNTGSCLQVRLHNWLAADYACACHPTNLFMCADVRELVMERVRKHFQPEFLNRIDEFICFEPLRCGCWYRRTPC